MALKDVTLYGTFVMQWNRVRAVCLALFGDHRVTRAFATASAFRVTDIIECVSMERTSTEAVSDIQLGKHEASGMAHCFAPRNVKHQTMCKAMDQLCVVGRLPMPLILIHTS